MVRHDHLHALAGAYVLDALMPAERRRFERHLPDCETCGLEVRGLRETTARLALAAARTPPPGLRGRVLAATQRTRQTPPSLLRPPRKWSTRPYWILAAACLPVAVALAGTAWVSRQHADPAETLNHKITMVLSAPDVRTVTASARPTGNGIVMTSRTLDEAVIVMSGLPALPPKRTYQLWLMSPASTHSVTTMKPPTTGPDAPIITTHIRAAIQIAITIEPAGGSARQTSTPIFLAALP